VLYQYNDNMIEKWSACNRGVSERIMCSQVQSMLWPI